MTRPWLILVVMFLGWAPMAFGQEWQVDFRGNGTFTQVTLSLINREYHLLIDTCDLGLGVSTIGKILTDRGKIEQVVFSDIDSDRVKEILIVIQDGLKASLRVIRYDLGRLSLIPNYYRFNKSSQSITLEGQTLIYLESSKSFYIPVGNTIFQNEKEDLVLFPTVYLYRWNGRMGGLLKMGEKCFGSELDESNLMQCVF
jgi:hypothetical protein